MKHIFCIRTFFLVGFLWLMGSRVKAQAPDWKWQNPLPTGNELRDVHFIDFQTGWTVGEFGTILKTNNGGQSWQTQASGTKSTLYSIYFINAQIGWATGEDGVLIKTTNGGQNWQNLNSGTSNSLLAIYFTDALNGWVAGKAGLIRKTTDGGQSWQTKSGGTSANLNSIHFTNPQIGWTVGSNGTIRKTNNGGQTWGASTSGTTNKLASVFFVDSQTGWAVGSVGTILKTTNGGQSWLLQGSGTTISLLSVSFIDSQNGWAVGVDGIVVLTSNGGLTWQSQNIGTDNDLFAVSFTSALTGWAVGWRGSIHKTIDGGLSWQAQSIGNIELNSGLRSVCFSDAQTGWAVGDNGTILKTGNGGHTWMAQNSGTSNDLWSVHFTDSQTGWAVGWNGTILKTTDGGQTWQTQTAGITNPFYSVHFTDNQHGWVVGQTDTIFKTTNGGLNWQMLTVGSAYFFSSVYFIDSLTGWVAGTNGSTLKTTNGGLSWQNQSVGSFDINSIYFRDSQTGWVVGTGIIRKTVDGGQTWQQQNSGTQHTLHSIHFSDAQNGYAVGDSTILKTNNGGQDWIAQNSGTWHNLKDVQFVGSQIGWAVGEYGTILTTLNNNYIDPDTLTSTVEGKLFKKNTAGCNPTTVPVPFRFVKATPGPFYGISDDNGSYHLELPVHNVTTPYNLNAIPFGYPSFQTSIMCPLDNLYNLFLSSQSDTLTGKDFGFETPQCYYLELQISSTSRRSCFDNTTLLSWINQGSVEAPNSYLIVEFPHWVRPLTASQTYTMINDSTLRFNLGTIQPGTGGNITIIDSVLCSAPINLTQCTKATIYPAPDCPPPTGWNGAEVTVSGECHNGNVELGIYNPTTHDMTDSVEYWVYLDSIQVRTGKVKLLAGDSLKMNAEAFGMTVTLTARQVNSHPSEVFVTTTIEACDETTIYIPRATANHFPKVKTPSSKTHCLPIRASYDPNDKQAFPIGFTSNHIVKPGTQMEYLVRFQNTGNDTAFTVYVIDSLDNNLNPETIELGAASHLYEISMQTTRQGRTYLRWQFNNILLSDSNTNELKSHGFFQYRISPKAGIALGTQARNEASIYFDFNPPVLTNQTLTTFDNIIYTDPTLNNHVQIILPTQTALTSKQIGVKLYPNPVTQNQLSASFTSKGSLTLYDSKGQVVYQKDNLEGIQTLPILLKSGFYFARISTEKGSSTEKIVVMD